MQGIYDAGNCSSPHEINQFILCVIVTQMGLIFVSLLIVLNVTIMIFYK